MNELINKHQGKIFIVVVLLVGMSALGGFENALWHWLDAVITIGTVVGVWYNYSENKKHREIALQSIPIIFNIDGEKYKLILDIPRKELTRSEVQGILSNYSTDSTERYNINYLAETDYLKHIYEIQSNERNELEIKLLKKELEGYSYETKNKQGEIKLQKYVGFDKDKMVKI